MRRLFGSIMFLLLGDSIAYSQPLQDEVDAFHLVVGTGGVAAVESYLKKKPELATALDEHKFQAIHVLDYIDFDEILTLLIHYGADINAQNESGHTLLHVLIDPVFVPTVLYHGADIEIRDHEGFTPLRSALTERDNYDMVRALLAGGADPNTIDNNGRSALSFAKEFSDDPEIVNLLRNAGATE